MPLLQMSDVLRLPSSDFQMRDGLPRKPGIYFVITGDGRIVYVGKSERSIRARWKNHHRAAEAAESGAVRIAWQLVPKKAVADAESYYIHSLRPSLNRMEGVVRSSTVATRSKAIRAASPRDSVSVRQLSRQLRVSDTTLYDWARSGKLPAIDISRPGSLRVRYVFDPVQVAGVLRAVGWRPGKRFPLHHKLTPDGRWILAQR